MTYKIIRDGNAFYEIDEDCVREKEEENKKEKEKETNQDSTNHL